MKCFHSINERRWDETKQEERERRKPPFMKLFYKFQCMRAEAEPSQIATAATTTTTTTKKNGFELQSNGAVQKTSAFDVCTFIFLLLLNSVVVALFVCRFVSMDITGSEGIGIQVRQVFKAKKLHRNDSGYGDHLSASNKIVDRQRREATIDSFFCRRCSAVATLVESRLWLWGNETQHLLIFLIRLRYIRTLQFFARANRFFLSFP